MSPVVVEHGTTIHNLMTAYKGELRARARYIAFAARAEEDGFRGVASLFRAVSRAEKIHADNHARVIHELGGQAIGEGDPVAMSTTLENLKAALAGERYEAETLYPGFLEEAKENRNTVAIRTFHNACEAEKSHAGVFQEAITLMEIGPEGSWITTAREFNVCPVCGYVAENAHEHKHCPVCNYLSKRFEAIR
jgi:rubrerythrin